MFILQSCAKNKKKNKKSLKTGEGIENSLVLCWREVMQENYGREKGNIFPLSRARFLPPPPASDFFL